jgi:regulator of sigma E protease
VVSALYWLLTIFGIGFVIFFHELGHYLAARAMGVRVEAFSIGFGPRLFGFRRGTTDWKICLIPLGGFVKMAGETPGSPRSGAPDEFMSKSVAARALIISAGVIMNVVLALIALPIAFLAGVPFESPVLGGVESGGPAWRAGLRGGDRVLSVDGRRTLGYEDVVTGIAIGGDDVAIVAERGGQKLSFEVPTVRDERRGLPRIGIGASIGPVELRPEDVDPGEAAGENKAVAAHRKAAGLLAGDRLLLVDGVPITDPEAEVSLLELRTHLLTIQRGGKEVEIALPPYHSPDQPGQTELFGLAPANLTVGEIVAGSPAAGLLEPKDRIAKVGEHEVWRTGDLARLLARPLPDGDLTVERGSRLETVPARLSDADIRRSLRFDVAWEISGTHVVPIEGGAAGPAGFRPGDRIVSVDGKAVTSYEDVRNIDEAVKSATFDVARAGSEGSRTTITVARKRSPANEALSGLEQDFKRETVKEDLAGSFKAGFDYTVMMTARVFMTLKSLFTARVSPKNLGGIITIFRQTVDSSKIAISRGLLFIAVISINLAVLNVLPIPVLDGGWLLLLLIERLRGKPVPEKVLGVVSWAGLVIVLGLMVFVTWNDIRRLF